MKDTSPTKIYLQTDAFQNKRPLSIYPYLRESLWYEAEKYGITRVTDPSVADFILTSDYEISDPENILPNTIVVDCSDGCHFSGKVSWIDNENIVAWVKRYSSNDIPVLRDKLPSCFFYEQLTNEIPPDTELRNKPSCFNKVVVGLGFMYIDHMIFRHRRVAELQPIDGKRDIDVFFAGTTHYQTRDDMTWKEKLISKHRSQCVDTIRGLNDLNTVVVEGKGLTFDDYVEHLMRSKVIISPWGYGEACYRDYEPLLYGCDVVKPQTTYQIQSFPDIYNGNNNKFLNWVDPNWGDLESTVRKLLDSWDHRASNRSDTKRKMLGYFDYNYQATNLVNIVEHAKLYHSSKNEKSEAA